VQKLRKYGDPPYQILLLHGGPGAAGYLSPLAGKLADRFSLIEAFQTINTISELIDEINEIILNHANKPVVLLGHSWGAWLSLLYASRYPGNVKKLILVASPPFEEKYAENILPTRMKRLEADKRDTLMYYFNQIREDTVKQKDKIFLKIASLLRLADGFELDEPEYKGVMFSFQQYEAIWQEAEELRNSGKLIRSISGISCPVLAIHGDHDPHPAEGVESILSQNLQNFRFELLEKCGHEPWSEKYAKERFLSLLSKEIHS
jgi:pimeloyl-ACP methyl ester carboxylesterase